MLSFEWPSPDDPGAAVSFSPCTDEECGAKPTTAEAAGCATGKKFTGATCGKLNGSSTCKWAAGCVTLGKPIPVDPADVGPACGNETNMQCPADKLECASLPLETGIDGPHCFAAPWHGRDDSCGRRVRRTRPVYGNLPYRRNS